ncbi:unnamed protein product, partial [Symbiodinium sp. KB8]
ASAIRWRTRGGQCYFFQVMAVPDVRIGLPNVPEGPDLDLDSPRSGQAGGSDLLTVEGLRMLLEEQSKGLLQAQQNQLSATLAAWEGRQAERLEKIESRVDGATDQVEGLQKQVQEIADRLSRVEAQPPSSGHGPDRKHTLVFGGWQEGTRRATLLYQLQQAISQLGLAKDFDQEPFCTGARRSVSLCVFRRRQGEDEGHLRDRMLHILQVINASKVTLEGAARPLWCAFSKSPEERGKASLATVVRKAVLRFAPTRISDVDVEYTTGRSWIKEDQLTGMNDQGMVPRGVRQVSTRGGDGWIDEKTLAKWVDTEVAEARDQRCSLVVLGWNVGGVDLFQLPKAVRDSTKGKLEKDDLLLLQEVPRECEGWSHQELEGRNVVTHRRATQWRGTGLSYDPGSWCVLRKLHTNKGTWFKVRHLERGLDLWLGTVHFSPGVTADACEEEVEDHFRALPRDAHRVVFQGDVNAAFGWVQEGGQVTAVAKDGKGHTLHRAVMERGLVLGTPLGPQMSTPTSRPRQENRQGQCIDIMAQRGLRQSTWRIHVDSYMCVGSDHELCESVFCIDAQKKNKRHETRPRVWTGGIDQVEGLDQTTVEELARRCTKPAPGHGYKDPPEVKLAFKEAKRQGTACLWKRALKLRKSSRRQWEWDRLVRASEGEWHSFKALKPRRDAGWDIGFADAQDEDPHQVVHDHLSQVYAGVESEGAVKWTGEVEVFTREELDAGLQHLKRGKAVGADKTSAELLFGLMDVPGGAEHLLEWFNRILATGDIPTQWNRPVVVMLPKIRAPKKAKELRPIAMGSAVSKLFSRMLLNRSLRTLSPQSYAQCSGKGRQTSDFLFTIIRLFELTREWGNPLVVFKMDLEKAFDSLDRAVLLRRLEDKLGDGAELNCWKGLLANTRGLLQTPWGNSEVVMAKGIKQGAVESPVFFAYVAELVMLDTITKYKWRDSQPLFPGLPPEEMMYMDDGIIWNGDVRIVESRAHDLSVEFATYGLKMNAAKCHLYVAPNSGERDFILLNGTKVSSESSLEVMGLSLKVGGTIYELVAPASSRARSKFWELHHLFRTKGHMKHRARVMERILGGTALWFICSVPPDKSAMTALNSTQLQLMVWLLKFAKAEGETWTQFRQRAFRGARAALHSAGLERWSTVWLRRYWRYAGHRVRTAEQFSRKLPP